MRVLLTGAAGRLGSRVCHHLVARGYDVVATDSLYRADLPVPLRLAELLDRHAVYPLLDQCEAVVHLANHPDMGRVSPPQRLYVENLTMNANVFHAAIERGIRQLVFASSIQAISGERDNWNGTGDRSSGLPYLPLDEHVPARPGNLYAVTKVNTEELLRQYVLLDPTRSCTAIRFPHLSSGRRPSGSHHHRHSVDDVSRLDEVFAYLSLDDASELIHRVLQTNRVGYIHFLPAAQGNYLGWTPAEVIARFYPNVPLKQPAEQMRALVDLDALEHHYGWTPTPDGVRPRWEA